MNTKWKKLREQQKARTLEKREATIKAYEKKYEDYKKARQEMEAQWKHLSLKQ